MRLRAARAQCRPPIGLPQWIIGRQASTTAPRSTTNIVHKTTNTPAAVSASDILSIQEALKNSEITGALEKISALSRRSQPITSSWILQGISLQLLRQILADGHQKDPLQFIKDMQNLGVDVNDHYDTLLLSLLPRGEVAKILPTFEAGITSRLKVVGNLTEGVQKAVFEKEGAIMYLTYMYLREQNAKSEIINALNSELSSMAVPSTQDLQHYQRKIPQDLFSRLRKHAINIELSDRTRLRSSLESFVERNDPVGLESFYHTVKAIKPPPLNDSVYSLFLSAFLRIWRAQDKVFDIWEDMVESGITPGPHCWNALLRYRGSDGSMLLETWNQMILSGVVPDLHCWTTRIYAQLSNGDADAGVDSFRRMMDSGVIPTTEVINATITGLLNCDRLDQAGKIMNIADRLGVRPNLITYNTLLKGLMKRAALPSAMSVINNMQENEIMPDVYTFGIILDGLFKQRSARRTKFEDALKILNLMEELGVEAGVETYTSLINGLLEQQNYEALEAVREIMESRNVSANADTYTVLIKDAFRRGDLKDVDVLWAELERKNVGRDHVLWSEMIWGYAQAGQISLMEGKIQSMKHEKHRIILTLKSYVDIVRALESRGYKMAGKKIVEDVVSTWRERSGSRDSRFGKTSEQFWEVVEILGGRIWMESLRAQTENRGAEN